MTFMFMEPKTRTKIIKSEESQRALDALREYLNDNIEEPMQFLTRFWKAQTAVITYAELRRIIEDEDVPGDIMNDWFHDYSHLISQRITPVWEESMIAGYLSNPLFQDVDFEINTSEEKVREWIATRSAEFITNCCEEQRGAIRYLIGESISRDMASNEIARYIRPCIGLTQQQAAANFKYYNNIKEQLKADHPRMRAETIERRARNAAARYAERQHRYRAETIARTEIATAYHRGNDIAVRQAMEQKLIPKVKKVWSTARDDKVCQVCRALEGIEIDMDSFFSAKCGKHNVRTMVTTLPPAHPRCACAVKYVEVKEEK